MKDLIYVVGIVKWYGGYNNKTDRENNFGFIESMTGEDIFIHKNEIKSNYSLSKDNIVIFKVGIRDYKKFAKNVSIPSKDIDSFKLFFQILPEYELEFGDFFKRYTFNSFKKSLLNEHILEKLTEDEFCEILPKAIKRDKQDISPYRSNDFEEFLPKAIISDNQDISPFYSDDFFKAIDTFITIKNEINKNLSSLICSNLDDRSITVLLNSSKRDTYLSNSEIKRKVLEISCNSDFRFNNNAIFTLIKYGIFNYETFIYDSSFINYAFEHFDDNLKFFEIINLNIKKDDIAMNKFLNAIRGTKNWVEIFYLPILKLSINDVLTKHFSISLIPPLVIRDNEFNIFEYILSLEDKLRETLIDQDFDSIPVSIQLALILNNIELPKDKLNKNKNELRDILGKYIRDSQSISSELLKRILNIVFKDINKYIRNLYFKELIEPLYFKYLLYNKNINFKSFYENSIDIKNSVEYFILSDLFQLILAKNNIETAYEVFQKHLWDAIKNGMIKINDKSLFNLFPQCYTMGELGLACEAFFWKSDKDGDKFLCRNKLCSNPQVLPDRSKNYLDYNIYDWFSWYGIDYLSTVKPSKQDFPIKLAGYFNRLNEIYKVLKCRKCSSLMFPNMSYARNIPYYEYDNNLKKIIKKQLTAAYRVTVFRCINAECSEYNNDYYINHCLGFGCYEIIDSRDLSLRCKNGRYICNKCGSCCEECAKSYPNGFCPICGHPLTLFEKNGSRFVYCSNRQCKFKIPKNELVKKFLSRDAPVKMISSRNYSNINDNNYSNPSSYIGDDEIPF